MQPVVPRIEFYTAADGRRLAVRVWAPQEAPRARVIFLHGITSHGGWYNRSCRHLAAAGVEVHFLDRRGSGLNARGRGDVDRYETWISDVATYMEMLPSDGPTVLAGISWGGKLAAVVARQRPELMQGLALICPGLYAYQQPDLLKRLILSSPIPPRIQNRRVSIPLADPRLFTDTPPWIDYVADDPLSLREITIRFAREDLLLTEYARETSRLGDLDVLLVLAGRDRIVDNAQTRAHFEEVEARSKRLLEYAGAAHTLEFEPDPQPYFDDLTGWIGQVNG